MGGLSVSQWKEDHVGSTGWREHARAELARRLRQALQVSPSELKRILRHVRLHQEVVLDNLSDEHLEGVRQMLQELGGEVVITSFERPGVWRRT
jgi:hypothetical protein